MCIRDRGTMPGSSTDPVPRRIENLDVKMNNSGECSSNPIHFTNCHIENLNVFVKDSEGLNGYQAVAVVHLNIEILNMAGNRICWRAWLRPNRWPTVTRTAHSQNQFAQSMQTRAETQNCATTHYNLSMSKANSILHTMDLQFFFNIKADLILYTMDLQFTATQKQT